MPRPEDAARIKIDSALLAVGWLVQDRDALNIDAARGVAVRHFPLKRGHGEADFLLFVDGQAVGVVEAKREGTPLTGVEVQAEKYATGIPDHLDPPVKPLPFLYQSTGIETAFTNGLVKAEDLLSSFRNSYNPRIVVMVDMIATGTDVKPLEVVMFRRAVRSRNFFEQMQGRGVRTINPTDLQAVTSDAQSKERFVLVDCNVVQGNSWRWRVSPENSERRSGPDIVPRSMH